MHGGLALVFAVDGGVEIEGEYEHHGLIRKAMASTNLGAITAEIRGDGHGQGHQLEGWQWIMRCIVGCCDPML